MKKSIFLMLGAMLLLMTRAYAYDDGDFQVWNTDVEELKVNENTKLAFEEEFRWADNANEFYYQHYDAGISYALNKSLNIGGGYRHIVELKRGKFRLENEPYLTATVTRALKGIKFEDRSRFEYQHFDYQDDTQRYRNKFTVKLPWKFSRLDIQPFFADEIFILFDDSQRLNQNRASVGLGASITKNIKVEIYYLSQNSKSAGKWKDTNVLGSKLKITF
jgi:hypothetical protein